MEITRIMLCVKTRRTFLYRYRGKDYYAKIVKGRLYPIVKKDNELFYYFVIPEQEYKIKITPKNIKGFTNKEFLIPYHSNKRGQIRKREELIKRLNEKVNRRENK